ncbi:unnamed protein product [Moneuplotes crassus]|uniref:EamA domain-containing protein n=1 Tax=Euplotes crassus TaxID=5936 RepID=A0AAD2CW96_EUPCR|nr:unnamed protein product [Moneuplotes crassus]
MDREFEEVKNSWVNNHKRDSNSENEPSLPNLSYMQHSNNSEEEVPLEISDYDNSWEVKYMDDTILNCNVNITKYDSIRGFTLMALGIICATVMHVCARTAFARNPELTNFDTFSFIGYILPIFYLIAARIKGVTVNLYYFEEKIGFMILFRTLASNFMHIFLFAGFKYMSDAKGTLIFNLNPIFCIIIAFFVVSERINALSTAVIIGSLCGIYLFGLNESYSETIGLLGYLLVFVSSGIYGCILVLIRLLNIRGVHYLVPPFYIGVMALVTTGVVTIFFPTHISMEYDSIDILYLGLYGLAAAGAQLCLNAAFQYELAITLCLCQYLERVLILLVDILLFGYAFSIIDIMGISLIILCIATLIIVKII